MCQVDALRLRLEEKESFLNKKTKQLQDLTEEKGTLAGEIRDMKDMLEVKERKINVLQKKVMFSYGIHCKPPIYYASVTISLPFFSELLLILQIQ